MQPEPAPKGGALFEDLPVFPASLPADELAGKLQEAEIRPAGPAVHVGDLDAPAPNQFDPSKRGFQP